MTVEEKRKAVQRYCAGKGASCEKCVLSGNDWTHKCKGIGGINDCLHIRAASEDELDRALELIGESGAVLPVRQAEGIKSAVEVIQLEVGDGSALRVAHAICKECVQTSDNKETALIYLDELTEHIDAYVRAERKALEYKKLVEEV